MAAGNRRRRQRPFPLRPPRPRWVECETTGKRGFSSRVDAVAAMARFSIEDRFKGQRVYRCPYCFHFHATSKT